MRFKTYYLTEKVLDTNKINTLKKEFLTLMKNVKTVKDYDMAKRWSIYVENWTRNFDNYSDEIYNELDNSKFKKAITEEEHKKWNKKLKSTLWDFYISFRVPIGLTDEYWTKKMRFNDYMSDIKKWETKVRRMSRPVWKVLDEFSKWFKDNTKKDFDVPEEQKEKLTLSGYPVVLLYSEKAEYNKRKGLISKLKSALDIVNSKKSNNGLITKIPIYLDMTNKTGLDAGGRYRIIDRTPVVFIYSIAFYGSDGKPINLAKILVHEMGHHMYATLLSKKKKDLWDMFIKGNYSELDLNNVYKKYKDAKKSGQKNAYLHLNEIIEKEDPIMYLQLGALLDTHAYKHTFGSIMTMDDLKKYMDDGGETKIRVHTLPISAYAHKNSEEAFCEAVSLYTIYGSKAVLPKVEYILKEIL